MFNFIVFNQQKWKKAGADLVMTIASYYYGVHGMRYFPGLFKVLRNIISSVLRDALLDV